MTVRELTTKLGFKVKENDIEQAESRVKKMSMGMKLAITGAVVGILAIGKKAIDVAADMETLNTQFEVMLGSVEAAKKMMSNLREFSIRTPFETEDLAQSTTTLLQFGIQSEKIMETLQMLGDVAGSNRERFQSLALVYGQIQSTGKLMGQDLLQLINQKFNPLTVIAKKTGKTVSQLKDEMSKGLISAEMVTEAFRIATAEGGQFFQNMKKQSLTLPGLLSTMRGAFKEVLIDLGNALLPLIKELTKTLTELAKGGLRDLVGVLVKVLVPLLKLLSELISPLIAVIIPLHDAFMKVIRPIINIIRAVLLPTFEALKPIIGFLIVIFEAVAIILEGFLPLIQLLGEIIKALMPILKPLLIVLGLFLKALAWILNLLIRGITIILKPIQWLIQGFSWLAKFLIKIFKPVFAWFVYLNKGALQYFISGLKWFVNQTKLLVDLIFKLGRNLKNSFVEIFNSIISIFSTIFIEMIKPISILFSFIDDMMGNLFSAIGAKISSLFDWFTNLFSSIWNWLKDIFGIFMKGPPKEKETKLKLDIKSKIPNVADAMKSQSGSRKQPNINMQNQIAITTTGGISTKAGVKRTMEEAAKSIFSLELQKLLINAGV
jgi:tape measure domain-containing protein